MATGWDMEMQKRFERLEQKVDQLGVEVNRLASEAKTVAAEVKTVAIKVDAQAERLRIASNARLHRRSRSRISETSCNDPQRDSPPLSTASNAASPKPVATGN